MSRKGLGGLALLLAIVLIAAGPASAAGFSIFEAGSRATGMGGAFVGVANDQSAMFYNPAGLGEQAEKGKLKAMVGVTLIMPDSKLDQGADPYPGSDYSAKQKSMIFFPPNFYASYGLSECLNLSFGTWFPFGLSTAWEDQDSFRGQYVSQRVDLRQYSMGLQLGWKVNEYLSVGAGPELRVSDVKLQRNVPLFNPFTNRVVTAAHADIVGDGYAADLTFGAGIKINPTPEFSIGASYHGAVTSDYSGAATFYKQSTGNAQLDGAFAAKVPLDKPVPVETAIDYPAMTQVGISYTFNKKLTLAASGTYTQWDAFKQITLTYGTVDGKTVPATTIDFNYENAWAYRVGIDWKATEKLAVLAGFVYDQTPQPDESVSPLLPDANRTGYSIGLSAKIGQHTWVDFSNLFLFFHERTTLTNKDNFNGTYKTFADLAVLNLRTSF
jgi:long-chain fatty acid transport protein